MDLIIRLIPDSTAGSTVDALTDCFAKEFDDPTPEFAGLVICMANEVIQDLKSRRDWRWLHGVASIVFEAGNDTYPLDDEAELIDNGVMVLPGNAPIRQVDDHQLLIRQSKNPSGGVPEVWAQQGANRVVFHPTPVTSATAIYHYTKKTANLSSGDDQPPMPPIDQHVFRKGIRAHLRASDDDNDRAAERAFTLYENAILTMAFREDRGKHLYLIPETLPPSAEREREFGD